MGKIQTQLADEAEEDRLMQLQLAPMVGERSSAVAIFGIFFGTSYAEEVVVEEWTEQYTLILTPDEWAEVKLALEEGTEAEFLWVAAGGVINYDLHGDGSGTNVSYEEAGQSRLASRLEGQIFRGHCFHRQHPE